MISRNARILDGFRGEALARDIPEADVERWMGLVRPCALLTTDGDGPVVGTFGGPIMLPADAEKPWFPLVATIDCAALPPESTDLPLPSDGNLLFFGYPDEDGMGDVVHVPEGAPVREWTLDPADYPACDDQFDEIYQEYPQGDIHLTSDVSLPFVGTVEAPAPAYAAPLPGHPRSEELGEVWADQWGSATFLLGGYGTDCNGSSPTRAAANYAVMLERTGRRPESGPVSPNADDWVLLAEFAVHRPGGGANVYWVIQRDDLVARRFDRACSVLDWNP